MKKLIDTERMKRPVLGGIGLMIMGLLLSAGVIAQNSTSNPPSQAPLADMPAEQAKIITDKIAELKARITQLETQLQQNREPAADQAAAHDHATGDTADMDHGETEMVHDGDMEARITQLEIQLQQNRQPATDQAAAHDHATGDTADMDHGETEMVHDGDMEGMHMGGCMDMMGKKHMGMMDGHNHNGHMRNH